MRHFSILPVDVLKIVELRKNIQENKQELDFRFKTIAPFFFKNIRFCK